MTTPAEPPRQQPEQPDPAAAPVDPPVDLGKHPERPPELDPNDPYRFGLPDTPPPPEFAPPGWTPPGGWSAQHQPDFQSQPQPPTGQQRNPWQQPPGGYPPPYPGPYPGPPSYPPYPGNQPPPYPPYPYPADQAARQRAKTRRRATASLVLGIVSIVMFWTAFLDVVLVIAATAFGVLALSDRSSAEPRQSSGRRLAVAGLVCAAVGAVAAVAWTVYLVHVVNNCGGFNQPNTPALRACLQRQI